MYQEENIKSFAAKLIEEKRTELDAWRVSEDLEELYQEITQALIEKGPEYKDLMPRYCELMQREQDLYNPFTAYLSGRRNTRNDCHNGFMNYLRSIMEVPDNRQILNERDKLFYKMCDILGNDERRQLLSDYNEIFRQYHGILSFHIHQFFEMGFHEANA